MQAVTVATTNSNAEGAHHGHQDNRNRIARRIFGDHRRPQGGDRTSPSLIIIDHTGVPDALRGKGVGQALAAHAIDEARKGGWKIIPLCPFFKAQTLRHAEWADVIQG